MTQVDLGGQNPFES